MKAEIIVGLPCTVGNLTAAKGKVKCFLPFGRNENKM